MLSNTIATIAIASALLIAAAVGLALWLRHRQETDDEDDDTPISWRVSVVRPFNSDEWAWVYRRGDYVISISGYNTETEALAAALIYAECVNIEQAGEAA